VVPYGVDLDIFQPGLAGGRELVAAVTGDNKPYVISVATLFRGKNLPMLRDAVARLQARGFPHRLVLVTGPPGDGSDREAALTELRLGRELVVLFEKVEEHDLAALLAGACAFCLPSRFEGFGIPALEALACGVPTIVSGGGALPEVVADAGLVIEPTVQAIEDALAAVLADEALARRMALIGRRRAERFPWTATAEGWKRACERAIAAH
jgi:glycosyltransferase involved in cell wall biosynthesis